LSREETELNFSGQDLGAGDAVLIANDISDMGAMTKFDISSNNIQAEGGKALAAGLKGNQVIMELNISNNRLGYDSNYGGDTSGVIAIADTIPDMGALLTLNISNNEIVCSVTANKGNSYNVGDKVHYRGEQCTIWYADPSGYKVHLNGGLIALSDAIKNSKALTSLNLARNSIGGYKDQYGTFHSTYSEGDTHLLCTCNPFLSPVMHIIGLAAIVDAIKDNGTLIKLDISSNVIRGEQEGDLQRICMASDIELVK
jgi:hypothetical protein